MSKLRHLSSQLHRLSPSRAAIVLPFIYMAIIFALSSIEGSSLPEETPQLIQALKTIIFNGAHIPLFALLTWLWCWSLASWNTTLDRRMLLAFCFTALYGCLDELHQSFTPGRDASFLDIMLDMLGAYLAVCFYRGQIRNAANG